MIAFVTNADKFTSKKGNDLLALTCIDTSGKAQKVILKDIEDTKFNFSVSILDRSGKCELYWHKFEFDQKGYCVGIEEA